MHFEELVLFEANLMGRKGNAPVFRLTLFPTINSFETNDDHLPSYVIKNNTVAGNISMFLWKSFVDTELLRKRNANILQVQAEMAFPLNRMLD